MIRPAFEKIEFLEDLHLVEEQYQLCKETDMHSGILSSVCLKYLLTLYLTGRMADMKRLCPEAKHHTM